jgi:transcriptional regulator with XRE-family HTH domain
MKYTNTEPPDVRWPDLLRRLREKKRVSMRVLADSLGLSHSLVHRAENGGDCHLSTWMKLFSALGCLILTDFALDDEEEELLTEETERRQERKLEGLTTHRIGGGVFGNPRWRR